MKNGENTPFFPDARTDARTDGGRRAARFSFEMLRSGGESRSGADGGSFGTELLGREGPVKLRKRALRFASHSAESMSGEEGKKKTHANNEVGNQNPDQVLLLVFWFRSGDLPGVTGAWRRREARSWRKTQRKRRFVLLVFWLKMLQFRASLLLLLLLSLLPEEAPGRS